MQQIEWAILSYRVRYCAMSYERIIYKFIPVIPVFVYIMARCLVKPQMKVLYLSLHLRIE
jgi:hypothetical protein